MSKFNGTNKATPTGTNMAGGVSFDRPIKKEVVSVVLNSMLNGNSYYEKETDRLARIENLIKDSGADSEFVAKAAVYTRTEGRLRSVSHFLSVLLLESVKGESYIRKALEKVMLRLDDATEIVSLWNIRNKGKMIPNALRRAIKHNLETKWDLYSMKKYAQPKSKIKAKDLVKLCHPNPKVWNANFNKESV
jgi:hypothetical protein